MNRLTQLAFRDLFIGLMAVFFLYFLVPHKPHDHETDVGAAPQGELRVEITWPQEYNVDIDLWVYSPEGGLVGYSNKGSKNCNLLRDDLGTDPHVDPLPVNFESTTCRKFIAGEWVINVNFYGGPESFRENIPVTIVVTEYTAGIKVIAKVERVLERKGHESTALHFYVDSNGNVHIDTTERLFNLGAAGDQEGL